MKGQVGYRRLLFAPTDKGFAKWCFEVRKSKAFMKMYSLLSDESRLWHLAEYNERKKLLGQLSLVKSRLGDDEETYFSLVLSGKEKLDHRVVADNRIFAIWKESEELVIDKFRTELRDIPLFLKELREGLGMSKTEIAAIIGISPKVYSSYEKGGTKNRLALFPLIILLCGIDLTLIDFSASLIEPL